MTYAFLLTTWSMNPVLPQVDIGCSTIEQNLLYLLAANDGGLLIRKEIMDHLWAADYQAKSNMVDRYIRNMRIKLQNSWKYPR